MLPVSLFSNGEMGITVAAGADFTFFFNSLSLFQPNLCLSETCLTVNDRNVFHGMFCVV